MARKAMIIKNEQRSAVAEKYRAKRTELRNILKSQTASDEEKDAARIKLNKLPRRSIAIRVSNRCKITGRSRGFLRKFQMSRISFRENASLGLIPGVTKSSW